PYLSSPHAFYDQLTQDLAPVASRSGSSRPLQHYLHYLPAPVLTPLLRRFSLKQKGPGTSRPCKTQNSGQFLLKGAHRIQTWLPPSLLLMLGHCPCTSAACLSAAATNSLNNGWGRFGLDSSSGWNWVPKNHGCP